MIKGAQRGKNTICIVIIIIIDDDDDDDDLKSMYNVQWKLNWLETN
jgi:hypothetical protein